MNWGIIVLFNSVQFSRSVMSNSLWPHEPQPSHPLSSPSLPAPNPSQHHGLFKWISCSHRWPKYSSFSFNISPTNEHPGLISFRMGWLALLAVRGTLKSLLQHHRSKASILQGSAFFIVQLSHPYMSTGQTIALTIQNFVGKVMSLLFSVLSRLVITFLPGSKHLLIHGCSEFGAQENKVWHCFHCFFICLPWSDGTGCHPWS